MIANISLRYLAELIMINAVLAQSEYIAIRTGVFSLATPAFGAVGGFVSASFLLHDHMPVVIAVLAGVVFSGVLGLVLALPLSRLRGVFQGIATLGIVIIVQNIAELWTSFTGGAPGLQGIPRWASLVPISCIFFATVFIIVRVDRSVAGHKMTAIRIDELVAAANGINVFRYQLAALIGSGVVGGLGGALLAGNQYSIDPTVFGFALILQTVAAVFLGGLGLWIGPIIGAAILVAIPEFFSSLAVYEPAVAGGLLIAVVVLLPGGVWRLVRAAGVRALTLVTSAARSGRSEQSEAVTAQHAPVTRGEVASGTGPRSLGLPTGRGLIGPAAAGPPQPRGLSGPPADDRRRAELGRAKSGIREASTLAVNSVSRSFAGVRAVSDITCAVSSGDTVGLIGPNGAGKSTLVNLICGNLFLDSGTVALNGQRIDRLSASTIFSLGVRRTFQTCRLLPAESVLENVSVGFDVNAGAEVMRSICMLKKSDAYRRQTQSAMEALSLCGLADRRHDLAGSLPYAAQRRLEIARALAPGGCRILLLDEPAAGMTDAECGELQELIDQIAGELNIGVLLIEHHVEFVFNACSRVIVVNSGSMIAEGSPEKVRGTEAVVDAYLGRRHA